MFKVFCENLLPQGSHLTFFTVSLLRLGPTNHRRSIKTRLRFRGLQKERSAALAGHETSMTKQEIFVGNPELVLSLVPGKIGYRPGKLRGPGRGRGLVSIPSTRLPEIFKPLVCM